MCGTRNGGFFFFFLEGVLGSSDILCHFEGKCVLGNVRTLEILAAVCGVVEEKEEGGRMRLVY